MKDSKRNLTDVGAIDREAKQLVRELERLAERIDNFRYHLRQFLLHGNAPGPEDSLSIQLRRDGTSLAVPSGGVPVELTSQLTALVNYLANVGSGDDGFPLPCPKQQICEALRLPNRGALNNLVYRLRKKLSRHCIENTDCSMRLMFRQVLVLPVASSNESDCDREDDLCDPAAGRGRKPR